MYVCMHGVRSLVLVHSFFLSVIDELLFNAFPVDVSAARLQPSVRPTDRPPRRAVRPLAS